MKIRIKEQDRIELLLPDSDLSPQSVKQIERLPSFYSVIRSCEESFQTDFDRIPLETQSALVLRRLQQITNSLLLNPVWIERLGALGISDAPHTFEDWQHFPITDKETYSNFYSGSRSGLVVPIDRSGYTVIASGGTSTGKPVETIFPLEELQHTYELAGKFLSKHLIGRYRCDHAPTWVVNTYADYQMWSSGTMVGGVMSEISGVNYIAAGPMGKQVFQHLMTYPGPKAFVGMTNAIANLARDGGELSEVARTSLRAAMYCSGTLGKRDRSLLKATYPNVDILSYFSATQAEAIAIQLSEDSPYLSAVPGLFLLEIVDGSGKWVAEGEDGELLVTRLHTLHAPVIRYRLGDRMIRRPACETEHLQCERFEFNGRSGDFIHLADTQFSAPSLLHGLFRELDRLLLIDVEARCHGVQFVNDRRSRVLRLMASIDDASCLQYQLNCALGHYGASQLFSACLIKSLSLFNKLEANPTFVHSLGYQYEILFVCPSADAIYHTELGKTPLVLDTF